jgi:putrescine---pyruvate transaminase
MNAVLSPHSERTTQEWQAADSAHFLHPFTDFQSLARKGSRIITKADNIYLWDSDGHKILDAMSGLWCVNVGYGQQALVDAATRQMKELPFYNAFFQTATTPAIELAELLCEVTPPHFNHVFFSGSVSLNARSSSAARTRTTARRWPAHRWAA